MTKIIIVSVMVGEEVILAGRPGLSLCQSSWGKKPARDQVACICNRHARQMPPRGSLERDDRPRHLSHVSIESQMQGGRDVQL